MRINLFRRNEIGSDELIECLKDYLERKKQDYASMREVLNDNNDIIRILKSASDQIKEEFEKEAGISADDLLFLGECLKFEYIFSLMIAATTYLSLTDVGNLINDKDVEEIINNTKQDYPNWLDVFQNLIALPSFVQRYYIAQINCDNATKENLKKALEEKNYTSFNKCVSPMGKESYLLVNVVDLYKVLLDTSKLCEDGPDNYHQNMLINKISSELEKDTNAYNAMCKIIKMRSYVDASSTKDELKLISSMRFDEMKDYYLWKMNLYLTQRMAYLKERDSYPKEIQDIVDPYVVDPEEIVFYVELKKRGCTFDAIEDNGVKKQETIIEDNHEPNTDIFLPNDFFHIQNRNSEKSIGILKIIFIQCDEAKKKYCELINHLAKHGYIGDSQDVKRNLAYKLSGYYIEYNADSIEWHGETNILSVLISRMVEHGQKWKNAKKAFVFDKDVRLYNSSSLRNDNSYDLQFAELFKRLYSIDLYK